jgi:polyvinyl alcohol dehydrogenase (cytochrome)
MDRFFGVLLGMTLIGGCAQIPSRKTAAIEPGLTSSSDSPSEWLQWSGDIRNNHYRSAPGARLTRETVGKLHELWRFKTQNSVHGIPTVKDGFVYFGDNGNSGLGGLFHPGYIYSLYAKTGRPHWYFGVHELTGENRRNVARVSPAIAGDYLVTATLLNQMKYIYNTFFHDYRKTPGSSLLILDRNSGNLVEGGKIEVDPHFSSRVTSSPVVYKGVAYIGISSEESQMPGILGGNYKCCEFRGSIVAIDLESKRILWKTSTISDAAYAAGFKGASVWGSSFPIDEKTRTIYVGTGNNFTAPRAYRTCLLSAAKNAVAMQACAKRFDYPDNYFDSILALDLDTGRIKWSFRSTLYDSWNIGCGNGITRIPPKREKACPEPSGTDSDFGQAPMLVPDIEITDDSGATKKRDVLIAAQKSGNVYAIDAQTGELIWKRFTGMGGALGGHEFGSATDGNRAYFQTTNMEHKIVGMRGNGIFKGAKTNGGYWTALDIKTGDFVWQTPDPASAHPLKGEGYHHLLYAGNLGLGQFAAAFGPLTLYNKLLFAGSLAGNMYASAPAIVDDVLYWGTGYPLGMEADHAFYAIGL